jgi:hypothetical protein
MSLFPSSCASSSIQRWDGHDLEYLQKSRAEVSLNTASKRTSFEAVDPLYGNVLVEMLGRYLYGVIRIKDISSARQFMEQLRGMP